MSKFVGILSLAIGGIIVADIIKNPKGTAAASAGVTNFTKPWLNALLGQPS